MEAALSGAALRSRLQVSSGLYPEWGRIVGFDNERGKGDHKHLDGKESVYRFVSIDQLLDDFMAEVERKIE